MDPAPMQAWQLRFPALSMREPSTVLGAAAFDYDGLNRLFHRCIQEQALDDVLIDVADYRHLAAGPGVRLVAHAADYGVDTAGHGRARVGLCVACKRRGDASDGGRAVVAEDVAAGLHAVFARALHAACIIEQAPELADQPLRFAIGELLLRLNDRLRAPNDAGTRARLGPPVVAWVAQLYGVATTDVGVDYETDPRLCFAMRLQVAGSPEIDVLRDRLTAAHRDDGHAA